jgi:hypothetical protein
MDNSAKLIARLALPKFDPRTEKELEDWVDAASELLQATPVCLDLFRLAWRSVCGAGARAVVARTKEATTYEALVDKVALQLFPRSTHARELEGLLWKSQRHSTVRDAEQWLKNTCGRYLRICCRRGRDYAFTDSICEETILLSLPSVVEIKLREKDSLPEKWDSIIQCAYTIEAAIAPGTSATPQPLGVFAADEDEQMEKRYRSRYQSNGHMSRRACFGCGSLEHFYKICPMKNHRCANCRLIGHTSSVCRNFVIKDNKGRVDARVVEKPSRREIVHRKDRTQTDKVVTCEGVMAQMREVAEQRAHKAAEKRREKRVDNNDQPRRKAKEHPVALAQDEENSEDNYSIDDSSCDEEAEDMFYAHNCVTKGKGIIMIHAVINGKEERVMADTGASRSICSTETAQRLGLEFTTSTNRFVGLGEYQGTATKTVKLQLGEKVVDATFYVIERAGLPTLLGNAEMSHLNVFVDPKDKCVVDRETLEVVALSIAMDQQVNEELKTIDHECKKDEEERRLQEVKNLFDEKTIHLKEVVKTELWKTLWMYKECWLHPRSGRIRKLKAKFEVEGPPIKGKYRRLPESMKEELEKQLDEMLKEGVLRPSKSAWGSVPVFVKKPDGKWRLCLDYRAVNKRMKTDVYPIPLLWDNLQQAAGHNVYTTLDLQWGFWNLPLDESCKEYTAIITHKGTFEFEVLPFGIKNSPGEFQRAMDTVFGDLYRKGVLCYVDDIVIYANDASEGITQLEEILKRCTSWGLSLNFKKCSFLSESVKLLGHVISEAGILPCPNKIAALKTARAPQAKGELRSFLGATGFLRRFIPNFSEIAQPLNNLLKKDAKYEWGEQENNAFMQLKNELREHVLLSVPHDKGIYALVCDASGGAIGSALMQYYQDEMDLLEFASRRLNETEQRWSTREKEAFAIRWSLERFRDYIKAGRVVVFTDHESLKWMHNATSGKVQRWSLYMQQFDLEIRHIAGKDNTLADWLSRSMADHTVENAEVDNIAVPVFSAADVSVCKQTLIPQIPNVQQFVEGYKTMSTEEERELYKSNDGLYYHVRTNLLAVPSKLREAIMYWFHVGKYGGHGGLNKTLRRMRKWVWWPRMAQDVQEYIKGCLVCVCHTKPRRLQTASGVLSKPLPLQLISLDLIGPYRIKGEKRWILVIVDHATRFIMANATRSATAVEVVEVMQQQWCKVFLAPYGVLVDRGSCFISEDFRKYITTKLGAYIIYTSPYYPQGNGINEASHAAIKSLISKCLETGQSSFEEAIDSAVWLHNATPHVAIGESPYYAMFGFEPVFPGWQQYQTVSDSAAIARQQQEMRQRALVKSRLLAQGFQAKEKQVKVGDWVVFILSDYEKKCITLFSKSPNAEAHTTNWSLPAKVVEVKDKALVCHVMGRPYDVRQVSSSSVKVLSGMIPSTLVNLNLEMIDKDTPVRTKTPDDAPSATKMSWKDFMDYVERRPKKRQGTADEELSNKKEET